MFAHVGDVLAPGRVLRWMLGTPEDMPAPRRSALLLTALTLATVGCGGGGEEEGTGGEALAQSDAAEVLQAQRTIDAACGSDGSGTPDRSPAQISAAVGTLAGLVEEYPGEVYETGNVDRAENMSTVTERVSEQLRRCGMPIEADRLRKVTAG